MKEKADGDRGKTVRIAREAKRSLPIDEETAGRIVREWRNRDLVTESASGRYAQLTEQGAATEVVVEQTAAVSDAYLPAGPVETQSGP